jgi:hypothetical protein
VAAVDPEDVLEIRGQMEFLMHVILRRLDNLYPISLSLPPPTFPPFKGSWGANMTKTLDISIVLN